jgi:demethylspheroidene O-methyltransferase
VTERVALVRDPAEKPRDTLADRWKDFRRWLIAKPGFQRFAARFPFTKPIARAKSNQLFDLCAGFVYSQILQSAIRLKLFPMLAEGAGTLPVLAARMGLPEASAERLLKAAVALELIEPRSGGRYGLADLGAAVLANPGITAMVEHHAVLYADLADPVAMLRSGAKDTALGAYWRYARNPEPVSVTEGEIANYTELMAASQGFVADDATAAYDFSRHRRMLDVGGGNGSFCVSVAKRAPALQMTVLDLPSVAEVARQHIERQGFASRISAVGGDAIAGPLPEGHDLITFSRILHDHDEPAVRAMLRHARAALAPGGTLLIAEPMADAAGTSRMGDAYFGFYLFAMGSGRPRTRIEISNLLQEAGFVSIEPLSTPRPLLVSLLAAK